MDLIYRKIIKKDNLAISKLIKSVFEEFGIAIPGTVYTDPTTDKLFELFQNPQSVYWIVLDEDKIVGGCGIFPTSGLSENCAELVKFYLSKNYRGFGIGKKLIDLAFKSAKEFGYRKIYLESFPELKTAIAMYEKMGFERITQSMGNSGHHACNVWMIKEID